MIQDMLTEQLPVAAAADMSLLLVDDDKPFLTRLARAMESRGYAVRIADSVSAGIAAVDDRAPAFAVIDLRLADGNGLDVIARLKERRPEARGVVLTGYGNIATAVSAVKLGAFDFLAKPADADEIHAALAAARDARPQPPENPMSADRVRWEHIQRVYELCNRNVSETARRFADQRAAIAVRDDQADILGQDLGREFRRHGEAKGIAIIAIIRPFAIDAIVFDAGLDLDDQQVPRGRQRHDVAAAAVGEGHFGNGRKAALAQVPCGAAADAAGDVGPPRGPIQGEIDDAHAACSLFVPILTRRKRDGALAGGNGLPLTFVML